MRSLGLLALALVTGCSGRPTQVAPTSLAPSMTSSTTDVSVAPRDASAEASTASSEDARRALILARVRREALSPHAMHDPAWVAGPWTVRERDQPTPRLAALVRVHDHIELVSVGQEPDAPPTRWADVSDRPDMSDITAVLVRDVDRDGSDEVIVVAREEPVHEGIPMFVRAWVYTIDTSLGPAWEPLDRISLALAGDTDEAAIDASLASLGADEAPRAGTVPVRFIARLATASPAGFRAAIDPRGLRVCEPPSRGRRDNCRTLAAARISDAEVTRLQRRYFELVERGGTDPSGVSPASCRRVGDAVECGGSHYTHNRGLSWTVRGEGPAMRLVEVEFTSTL